MTAPRPSICFALFFLVGAALAQEQTSKPVKKDEAEVRFADSSIMRLSILQEKIEVQTRYGKLTIPMADVQRIEFGVHLPPDVAAKVEAAVVKLGSLQHAERDSATSELDRLGASAYPALLRAVKDSDPEVSRRAGKIVEDLCVRLPEKDLRSREEDIITTAGFQVVGRILATTLKARSEYFGGTELKLTHLRHLHPLRTPGEVLVVVDAAVHGSAHGQWMDTGIDVDAGQTVLIVASGVVDIYPQSPGQYTSTPKGYGNSTPTAGAKFAAITAIRGHAGALFARVGTAEGYLYVGERYDGSPGKEGRLFLHIVPSPWNNQSQGSYQARISLGR